MWRFVAHLVDQRSADDLTQEVYLRAVPALARFRGDAPVRLWLLAIARRVCADEVRQPGPPPAPGGRRCRRSTTWSRWWPTRSGVVDVTSLVEGLDDDRRTAFVLTQLLGLPYDEAARVCGVPVGTIRSRVARARADLLAAANADSSCADDQQF